MRIAKKALIAELRQAKSKIKDDYDLMEQGKIMADKYSIDEIKAIFNAIKGMGRPDLLNIVSVAMTEKQYVVTAERVMV